jgi:hypothetical protein
VHRVRAKHKVAAIVAAAALLSAAGWVVFGRPPGPRSATHRATPLVQHGVGARFQGSRLTKLPPESWAVSGDQAAELAAEAARAIRRARRCPAYSLIQIDLLYVRETNGNGIAVICNVDELNRTVIMGRRRSKRLYDVLARAKAQSGGVRAQSWPGSVWSTPLSTEW